MIQNPSTLEEIPPTVLENGSLSPLRMLATLAGLIYLAEIVAMIILYYLPISNYLFRSLLDGLIMIVLTLPGLYLLQLRPHQQQIEVRAKTEAALRAHEILLNKVLELLPVGVWVTDQVGKIIHGNPASRKIWGGAHYVGINGYVEYKGWWADSGKRIEAEEWAVVRAITNGQTTLNEEIEIEAFDGTRKIILNSAPPILSEGSKIQGAVIINQDITQRRLRERALVETNELLEKVFLSIDTLIAYMDRDFRFVRVNDTYARSGGHPAEYFIGKNHFDLYPNEDNLAIFHQVVATGEPYSVFEKPFQYPEFPERGISYWDWSLQPVKGADGRVEGVVLSMVDVTERKHAEIMLERQNQELRQLTEAEHHQRVLAETLSAAAQALTQKLDLEHVIHTLLYHLQAIVQADTAGVTLLDDQGQLAVRDVHGYAGWENREVIPSILIDGITDSVIQRIKLNHKALVLPNLASESASAGEGVAIHDAIRSWLVVPITASEKLIGLAEFGKTGEGNFSPEQVLWAEALAGQAAIAIQNAWLFQQVRSSSERLQSLTRKLVEIQENERYHIARELHDEAGQALSSLKLNLGRLEQDPGCPPQMRPRLLALKDVADNVLEELHRLAMDLRPVALDRLGLVAALEGFAQNLDCEQLRVKFKALGFEGERLPKDTETSLYRIVQEALTNVTRHAQATSVGILLERGEGRVKVFVEDDGIGFSTGLDESRGRLGLVGMRERAEMLGGSLVIESTPGEGTSIIVEVPDGSSDPDCG
jgi:PAS domain S-box-containing protein